MRVSVAALNFFDTLIIAGRYQVKPDLPFSPGAEACGGDRGGLGPGVEASGSANGCSSISVRRLPGTGGRAGLRPDRVPEGVSDEQAAGLSVTYGTSLHALQDRADLKARRDPGGARCHRRRRVAAVEARPRDGARVIACASWRKNSTSPRRMAPI